MSDIGNDTQSLDSESSAPIGDTWKSTRVTVVCPRTCKQGDCDISSGRCICDDGWGGEECDEAGTVWMTLVILGMSTVALLILLYFLRRTYLSCKLPEVKPERPRRRSKVADAKTEVDSDSDAERPTHPPESDNSTAANAGKTHASPHQAWSNGHSPASRHDGSPAPVGSRPSETRPGLRLSTSHSHSHLHPSARRSRASTSPSCQSGSPVSPQAESPGKSRDGLPSPTPSGRSFDKRSSYVVTAAEKSPAMRAVELRMHASKGGPMAERKKLWKELLLEYHPDKSDDPNAADVFQFMNAQKAEFLAE